MKQNHLEEKKEIRQEIKSQQWNDGYRQGYSEGSENARNILGEPYNNSRIVAQEKNFSSGVYRFHVVDQVKAQSGRNVMGKTFTHNNTIFVETGLTATQFDTVCNHEVLHNLFPEYEHDEDLDKTEDSIYKTSRRVDLRVCDRATRQALNNH